MNRFWEAVIRPCLESIQAKSIVEIGSDRGLGTKKIIDYCKEYNGKLISIDPFPKYDYEEWEKESEGRFKLYKDLSLNRLPLLNQYDAILVDGDHNWYSVYNELTIIKKVFGEKELPLIFLHDIGWPYARRDLYYNPDNIPEAYRQPYEKKGILPGELNLVEHGGLNDHLNNSIYENNLKNGVLTAIEDFLNELDSPDDIGFIGMPGFFGLGIIYSKNKHKSILDVIHSESLNYRITEEVEKERVQKLIENKNISDTLKECQGIIKELSQHVKENEKVKEDLQTKEETIRELEQKHKNMYSLYQQLQNHARDLKQSIERISSANDEFKVKYEEQLKENAKLKKELSDKNIKIKNLTVANNVHLNSTRYRLGDAIIKGLKPSIDTIKMPVRIFKLLIEGIRKKKNLNKADESREQASKQAGQPENLLRMTTVVNASSKQESVDAKETEKYEKYIISKCKKYNKEFQWDYKPLVSLVVLNHNSKKYLENLFDSIIKNVSYTNIEVILVDNASTDDSLKVIDRYNDQLKIKVIKNTHNESYSKANNQGAELASGEYLLFVNNDIEVFKGWLEELLLECLADKKIGAAGSLLLYPRCPEDSINRNKSFTIQHCGIKFGYKEDRIYPYNYLNGKPPWEALDEPEDIAGVTGASLMIEKNKFLQVGGFTEEYIYGYEDVDLCLKLIKKGYVNRIVPASSAFHFEFGTQAGQSSSEVTKRRLNNIKVFKTRWQRWLDKKYIDSLFGETNLFFDKKIKVAFAVTEAGENVSAGDYFTAMEYGEAMKRRGWEITFLQRKGQKDWYEVDEDVNLVISLLDAYDVRKIKCNNKNLITIAWARNWFERWASQPYINDYDYVVASSELACQYMEGIIGRKVSLLKIATNKDRFYNNNLDNNGYSEESLKCDYCFTGSYWNDPREIIDILNPEEYPQYKFHIYGENWDTIEKFAPYNKGFANYAMMPKIYANTKIVVDDANRVTKPFGSVNSRVFDALASGVLVLTNGALGADLTFNRLMPTYSNAKEFSELLSYYLTHEEERKALVDKLQKEVLSKHTYDNRVDELLEILGYMKPRNSIIIKTPVPKPEVREEWGDYHFAVALIKEFDKLGYDARLQYLNEWDEDDSDAESVIVLRGLSQYEPKDYHRNIMWNISHPDKISIEEYYAYDTVYIASDIWAEHIRENKQNDYTKIDVLMQCSDPEVFRPLEKQELNYDLLFVGNSRKIFRKIIKDLLPTTYKLSVYGTNWKGLIPDEYIKGDNIPNKEVSKHYASARILLNDHWDDMRDKGFISNRIFDALACKSFVISDEVKGIEKYFGNSVVTYSDKEDLAAKVEKYMCDDEARNLDIEKGYEIVIKSHTFRHRAKKIIEDMTNI